MVSLIVAASENKVIGKNNDLAWVLPLDLKYFKDTTKEHFVIMGRKNFESIPEKYRPLPNRTNIIVTRNADFKADNCLVVNSIEKALELANDANDQEPFIIGGGQIYKYAIENNLGYGKWLHGEAIACGFLIASSVAIKNKTMDISEYNKIEDLLKLFNLPTRFPKNLNIKKLFDTMLLDKKVVNNKVTFVLPKNIGGAYTTNKISKKIVMDSLKEHVE